MIPRRTRRRASQCNRMCNSCSFKTNEDGDEALTWVPRPKIKPTPKANEEADAEAANPEED